MKLFKQLLLLMLVLALAPTAAFGWLAISANRDALVTSALELAGERVEKLRLQLSHVVSEATRAVENLAIRNATSLDHDARRASLEQVFATQPDLAILTLYGPNGAKLDGLQGFPSREVTPTEVASHDAHAAELLKAVDAPKGLARMTSVYATAKSGVPAITIVVELPPEAGREIAAVAAELRLSTVQEAVEAQQLGASSVAYVVDEDGTVVAHPDARVVKANASYAKHPVVATFLRSREALESAGGAQVGEFPGEHGPEIAAFAAVPSLRWGVVYEQPKASAYAQVTRARDRALIGMLITAICAAVLAGFAARGVTKPVHEVVEGALQIARGTFGTVVRHDSRNELGDLAHTFNYMSKQLLAYDAENKELYESLERGYMETIVALANSIDSKDPYTRGHSQRVADLSRAIGVELELDADELKLLTYGGILHDIGKIGIVERILCKQSRLTDEEMVVMREHPAIGSTIIEPVQFLAPVASAVRNHHERWDGTGYPDKLKGEEIPLVARIVNCADTYDACTSTRPYQAAMSAEKALSILEGLRGTQLDPKVLDALVRVIDKRRVAGLRVSEAPSESAEEKAPKSDSDQAAKAS